ncbi:MAG: hypothetical protein MR278_06780 [Bacteroidales bacterium]|nr:hypothetical protein [Anaerotignum sp.]MCI5679661.1 hypothetical protein [Bacteroidales bacterium]MDY3925754.1 hypothetical protein [Anaerotignum sp.]
MIYAMILQNRVIGILPNQENEPHWPPDPAGNLVTAIPCDDTVTIGMMYDPETGEFPEYIPPEPEPQPEPIPTQLDRIEAAVNAKNEEIVQAAIDNYTLELMEGGLL